MRYKWGYFLLLSKGRITEQGSHDELVSKKGLYYAMWRQQIGERIPLQKFAVPDDDETDE